MESAVRFPEEMELANKAFVVKILRVVETFEPKDVERVETANCRIEKLEDVAVLRVEKVSKKLDVCPMVVDNVLKEERERLERSPTLVLTELTATCVIEKLLQTIVENEERPSWSAVPTLLIPTRRVLVSNPTNVE